MKTLVALLTCFFFAARAFAQSGCTDPYAINFDPAATQNNGSCTYLATAYTLRNPKILPAQLNETSGLIYTNSQLWTMNDSGGEAAIYRISETDGTILQTVTLSNATNTDWEALTADANYFYIGDFGNNTNGNRTNLKVYRVSKSALAGGGNLTVAAEVINFGYPDQVIQNPVTTGANSTKFDCEAFLVKDNLLHLFTKDWVTNATVHYTLPITPGNHVAERKEAFMVNGLITDAHISTTNANEIVLIGYTADLNSLFMWLLFDYSGNTFFSGNKRKIDLGSAFQGQIEGVTFTQNGNGYISSERISRTVFGFPVEVKPKLFSFSTATWVPLPIELKYFRATYTSPGIKLTWQTATEINNSLFTVERAATDLHFKPLGQQPGAGNSQVALNYAFTDFSPVAGLIYYRLKQTDWNGTFTYSPIISVSINGQDPFWQVSPQPVLNGQPLSIAFTDSPAPGTRLALYQVNGKIQFQKTLVGNTGKKEDIPTQHLPPGLYILQYQNSYTTQVTKVIIK